MNVKKYLLGVFLVAILSGLGQSEEFHKIVKRPGQNPLKCYKEDGVSQCVEIKPEDTEGSGPLKDPHEVEKGPLGGKIYRLGGSTMECFPNGQCFEVNPISVSTPAPTTVAHPTKIVKRPGKNPLKCFHEGGTSKCVEILPEDVEAGGGPIEDSHDVEKGPLGGKIYKMGDSMMECFPNGQCFDVNKLTLTTPEPTTPEPTTPEPTTPEPTTPEPTTKSAGKFYRRGKEIVECFPNGQCDVVEFVTYDSGKSCWISNDGNGSVNGDNGENSDGDANGNGENSDSNNDSGDSDAKGGSGKEGGDDGVEKDHGYWDYVDADDDEDVDTVDSNPDENEAPNSGKAMCSFKNSEAVQGSIILVEESVHSPMQVIGRLRGMKEGIHVLTFHENPDVETKGCHGVGGYHRPGRIRPQSYRRVYGAKMMDTTNAYVNCQRHVAACKARRSSSHKCETNLNKCVQILKCKGCNVQYALASSSRSFAASYASSALAGVTFDTIGDLEKSGHFTYKAEVPRNSLFVYADIQGASNFDEMEREQSLRGPDSVVGRSIVLSVLPNSPDGDFQVIACCKIEAGGPTVIM